VKILPISQNSEEWLEARKGRITGSKLKDLHAARGKKKDGFYQLIADRLTLADDDGDASSRDRGHEQEEAALDLFEQTTGKKVVRDCGMWVHDDNDNIAISPDGAIKKRGIFVEACEVKCLSAKNHLRAIIENDIGSGFEMQVTQYFVVNEHLKKLYFIFYDPRIAAKPMHVIEFTREQLAEDIKYYTEFEENMLEEVDYWVEKLAF